MYRAIRSFSEQSVKQSSLLGPNPILILYIFPNPISEVGGWCQPGNFFVFVSCVRCEAVCEREEERFLWLGFFSGFVARPPVLVLVRVPFHGFWFFFVFLLVFI